MDAVIEIAERTELRLEEYALAVRLRIAQISAGIANEGLYPLAVIGKPPVEHLLRIDLRPVDGRKYEVFPLGKILKMRLEPFGIEELARKDGLLLIFIGIERSNALLGGAELLVGKAPFLKLVKVAVPGHEYARTVADHEVVGRYRNALAHDLAHFAPEVLRIKGDAVAENIHDSVAEDAGGQKMQGEFALFVYYGVTRVAAALKADDHVIILGQKVDHTALAFIAPVDADYRAV